MGRVQVLRWRRDQQLARLYQQEFEQASHATARIVRPLLAAQLPAWAESIVGDATISHLSAIPSHKTVCDRESVIFDQPIRDYLTTKAFRIAHIAGAFVITVEPAAMQMVLITHHYRVRSRYLGSVKQGVWLPPGDYTQTHELASVSWSSAEQIDAAVTELLRQAQTRKQMIRRYSAVALADDRIRLGHRLLRQIIGISLFVAYVGLFLGLMLWCALLAFSF